ncbi:tRNA (adenosine(37)-N6)-dimethylallyltransferase MiaA [Gottfriedia luciferensis]|uniref:tRNA (adenosine(37)-N6)-dimethylallyltransferase MiaA n=1 Tax=Gottfriedia luciferensis TaxID=178774 RepID=UPI003F6C7E85
MTMVNMQKVIVIVGPTAVGKTKLSIELAKAVDGEIINGDATQVYKELNIGAAKVTEEEKEGIPHHLIDFLDPNDSFTVADFQTLAREKIKEIANRGKIPIIVGGTGLYIQSVLTKYEFAEQEGDELLRNQLEGFAMAFGNKALHDQLKEIDPESAKQIHMNNVRRVIRAIEVFKLTGQKFSETAFKKEPEYLYDAEIIGLSMDRELLYNRINLRVDLMLEEGLVDEAKMLYDKGIRNCQSVQAIGYKELYDYFDGSLTKEEAIDLIKQSSRRYAKRQMTWFRNKMSIHWFDMDGHNFDIKKLEILALLEGKGYFISNKYM